VSAHIVILYFVLSHDLGDVLIMTFFVKTIQYVLIYIQYTDWKRGRLVFYMNLGVPAKTLLGITYFIDSFLTILLILLFEL
jgi:hypothetical protein